MFVYIMTCAYFYKEFNCRFFDIEMIKLASEVNYGGVGEDKRIYRK